MASTNCTLVVTENGDLSVAIIIELNFFLNGDVGALQLFQKSRHGERGVVGTEYFSTQTRHVVCQMLVELRCLRKEL
jgi:hypothetical protein